MTDNIKSLVERLKKWAAFGYGADASSAMSEAADLIEQQAEALKGAAVIANEAGAEIRALKERVAELEQDLADQRDKHACVLRLMKCDEDFIALQIASVANKKGKE